MTSCELTAFGLSDSRGFLPHEDPLCRLEHPDLAPWEDMASSLSKLLVTGTIRKFVEGLPPFQSEMLASDAELKRAMVLLSFASHAYVFGDTPAVDRLPEILAKPWCEVAKKLGRPPALSYESFVLDNWRRVDPHGPIAIGNISMNQNFLGGLDEEWFVIVSVDAEAKAARALQAIADGRQAVLSESAGDLALALRQLSGALVDIAGSARRIGERCDPYIFSRRVRPYLRGWRNNPDLPQGLVYEGVAEFGGVPQFFSGESLYQSALTPSIESFLGAISDVDQYASLSRVEMRSYMLPQHRWFLEASESEPHTKEFVERHKDEGLRVAYSECLEHLETLRAVLRSQEALYADAQAGDSPAHLS